MLRENKIFSHSSSEGSARVAYSYRHGSWGICTLSFWVICSFHQLDSTWENGTIINLHINLTWILQGRLMLQGMHRQTISVTDKLWHLGSEYTHLGSEYHWLGGDSKSKCDKSSVEGESSSSWDHHFLDQEAFTLAIIKQLSISINVYLAFHLDWLPPLLRNSMPALCGQQWPCKPGYLRGHLGLHRSCFREVRLNGKFWESGQDEPVASPRLVIRVLGFMLWGMCSAWLCPWINLDEYYPQASSAHILFRNLILAVMCCWGDH